jgi:hypothetical protein
MLNLCKIPRANIGKYNHALPTLFRHFQTSFGAPPAAATRMTAVDENFFLIYVTKVKLIYYIHVC